MQTYLIPFIDHYYEVVIREKRKFLENVQFFLTKFTGGGVPHNGSGPQAILLIQLCL